MAGGGSSDQSGRWRPAWGEPSVSVRRRALTRAGGERSARVPLDPAHGRLLAPLIMASPSSPYRTATISSSENARLRRGEASRLVVSAWDARRRWQDPAESRGFTGSPECAREVSATADWLAEEAVQREPVSRPNSLIYGKIQGIRAATGSLGMAIWPDWPPARGLARLVPCGRKQGIDTTPVGIRTGGQRSPSTEERRRFGDRRSAGGALGAPAQSPVPMPPHERASHGWGCNSISGRNSARMGFSGETAGNPRSREQTRIASNTISETDSPLRFTDQETPAPRTQFRTSP